MHTTDKLEWFYREISWQAMWHTSTEIDLIHDIMFDIACALSIDTGLRWLNDRIEDDHRDQFGAFIKGAFPSIMTGIAHGLVIDQQQKLMNEFKGSNRTTTAIRKLHKRARKLTKRKKHIP